MKTEEECLKVLTAANSGYDTFHKMGEELLSGAMGAEQAEDKVLVMLPVFWLYVLGLNPTSSLQ